MIDDIERLKSSPCYTKLSKSQKAMFDEAYNDFTYWVNEGAFYRGGHAITTYVTGAASLKAGNPLTGTILAGAGWMNDNVGGHVTKTCVADIIVTYEKSFSTMKGILRSAGKQLRDPDCKGRGTLDGDGGKNKKGDDPSGVVYEGVLENPVAGATVTLYYAADSSGSIPMDAGSKSPATSGLTQLKVADDIRPLIPNNAVQVTGEDGKFAWGVPQGLWRVVAHKDGYTDGNSDADTVTGTYTVGSDTSVKLLPVLPVQLDVNIPLVDNTAPYVEAVRVTTEGVYVTFSKYMAEDSSAATGVLNPANYTLNSKTGNDLSVTSVEQGHTPSNRGTEASYTRTVLVKPADSSNLNGAVTLTVKNTVQSYAGTTMIADYSVTEGATAKATLAMPTFSLASGQVDRGTTVTISVSDAPSGTKIYYTTNGTDPSTTSAVYNGPVAITGDMTLKAKAFCVGYTDSAVASASYTVNETLTREQYENLHNNGDNNQNNNGDNNQNNNVNSNDYSGDDGSGNTITTPMPGEVGSLAVTVTVSGATATINAISDSAIADAVNGGGENANLVLDLTSFGSAVETVSIPAASWGKVADALEHHDGNDSVTVKTASGSVTLNEQAVSTIAGAGNAGSVELTIKNIGADGLTDTQAAAVAGKETVGAYALGVTVDGEPVEDFSGGFVSVNVLFTPEAGTDALDYLVYRVDENGEAVLVPSAVHDGELTVRSDRLEDIVIVYEPTENLFADVAENIYYEDAVRWASANDITYGTGDGMFSPDVDCTRAQVVTFLWRSAGSPEPQDNATFSDVTSGSYYEKAVQWAVENGITYGTGGNTFSPGSVCTRAQVVTFLCRMDGGNASSSNPFTDVTSDKYYYDAVRWAYANNITGGTGNNQYSPDAACTRAQIVTFLYRGFKH